MSIHLFDYANENNDTDILPRKRVRRLISDDGEPSGISGTSSEKPICKEIDNMPKI